MILKMAQPPTPPVPSGPGPRTLAEAAVTQTVVVASVAGQSPFRRRLLELGFVAGARVRVVRVAPLGDPMEVQLHGYHLSIRRRDAASVLVRSA